VSGLLLSPIWPRLTRASSCGFSFPQIHPALRVSVEIIKLSVQSPSIDIFDLLADFLAVPSFLSSTRSRRSSLDSISPCALFAKPVASSSSSSSRARSPLPNRSPSADVGDADYDEILSSPILAPTRKLGFTTSDEEDDASSSSPASVHGIQDSDEEGPSSPLNAPTSIAQFNARASQWSRNYEDEDEDEDEVMEVAVERSRMHSVVNSTSPAPMSEDVAAASSFSLFGQRSLLESLSSSSPVATTSTAAARLATFLQSRRGRTIPIVDDDDDEEEDEEDDVPEEIVIDFGPGRRRNSNEGRWSHHDDESEEEEEVVLAEESEQEELKTSSTSSNQKENPVLKRMEKLKKRKMSEEVVGAVNKAATGIGASSSSNKKNGGSSIKSFKPSDFLSKLTYISKDLSMESFDTDDSRISDLDDGEEIAQKIAHGTALLLANPDLADSEGSDDEDFEFRGAGWKEVDSEQEEDRETVEYEEVEEEEIEEEEDEPMEEIDEFDAVEIGSEDSVSALLPCLIFFPSKPNFFYISFFVPRSPSKKSTSTKSRSLPRTTNQTTRTSIRSRSSISATTTRWRHRTDGRIPARLERTTLLSIRTSSLLETPLDEDGPSRRQ